MRGARDTCLGVQFNTQCALWNNRGFLELLVPPYAQPGQVVTVTIEAANRSLFPVSFTVVYTREGGLVVFTHTQEVNLDTISGTCPRVQQTCPEVKSAETAIELSLAFAALKNSTRYTHTVAIENPSPEEFPVYIGVPIKTTYVAPGIYLPIVMK